MGILRLQHISACNIHTVLFYFNSEAEIYYKECCYFLWACIFRIKAKYIRKSIICNLKKTPFHLDLKLIRLSHLSCFSCFCFNNQLCCLLLSVSFLEQWFSSPHYEKILEEPLIEMDLMKEAVKPKHLQCVFFCLTFYPLSHSGQVFSSS